jgi:cell division protein FtsB
MNQTPPPTTNEQDQIAILTTMHEQLVAENRVLRARIADLEDRIADAVDALALAP